MGALAVGLGIRLAKPDVYELNGQGRAPLATDTARALRRCGQVVAVLDIDSPLFGRFGPQEQQALEEAAHLLEEIWPRENMV